MKSMWEDIRCSYVAFLLSIHAIYCTCLIVVSSSGYMRSRYREQNSERYHGVIVSQIKPKFDLQIMCIDN